VVWDVGQGRRHADPVDRFAAHRRVAGGWLEDLVGCSTDSLTIERVAGCNEAFSERTKTFTGRAFSGWTKTFTDPRLCAAIVDWLTFGGNIIETGTDSSRPPPAPFAPAAKLPPPNVR
jgi:hypothetical protein